MEGSTSNGEQPGAHAAPEGQQQHAAENAGHALNAIHAQDAAAPAPAADGGQKPEPQGNGSVPPDPDQEQKDQQDGQGDGPGTGDGGMGGLGSDDLGSDDMSDDEDNKKTSGGPRRAARMKKPHLQGRFSGRLATKEDERRLASECRLLAPLVGGIGKRGDRSRLTLAKIVRGIATGDVRKHLETRDQQFKDMAAKLDQLVQGNTTKHVRELQGTIDQLRRELDIKTRRILQLESSSAQQGNGVASATQPNLLVVQAPNVLSGLGGAGMLAAQGLDESLLLEQQLQQLQTELAHHQAQAQAAAQTHSVTLAHTQALHAEVRNLAAIQKQMGETEENAARLRDMAAAASESEQKVQLAFQTHHHHMQQANQVQLRLQQVQAQLALKRAPGTAASNANQLLSNLQQLHQRQAQAQAAQQVQQMQQAARSDQQVLFTLAGQGGQGGQASVMLFDPSMLSDPVIQW